MVSSDAPERGATSFLLGFRRTIYLKASSVCVFFKGIEILEARIFFKKDVVFERTMGIDSWRHIYIYIYLYIC